MSLFDRPGPRWFNIPAHRPFLEDLAAGLVGALSTDDPQALSQATVLVPSRRGARALAEGFVRASGGKALLLPQIRAVGDLDEGEPPFEPGDLVLDLPPAISPLQRRFELAGLVAAHQDALGRSLDAPAALELADALGAFFDSLQIEEAEGVDRLDELAPEHLAGHWRISAEFLRIAVDAWPARLAELGLMDVTGRRIALLRRLAGKWTDEPPVAPTIAAGSTGSAPATAALLAVVARLPLGCVVLPGLDDELSDKAWAEVEDQHPQGALRRLLDAAGASRSEVRPWRPEAHAQGRWRRRVINEALRPAEATADWRAQIKALRDEAQGAEDPIAAGLAGLAVIAAPAESQAADAVALLLREALETPGKTAALITPDQALARRVSARLSRWGVAVDSSAGAPLAGFPAAVLAALVAGSAGGDCDPVRLLAILKHPLVRLVGAAEPFERRGLRGPRPRDWSELGERLVEEPLALELMGALRAALGPAAEPYTGGVAAPSEAARGLVLAMEALAADDDGDLGLLWAGPAGEACAGLLSALMHESEGLPAVTPSQFADLLEGLLTGETVRLTGGAHPRLQILGALEGRLVRADRLVLAGLEEGVWPQGAAIDPFLSRPMRKLIGLPPPERRIGLSAHDFAQAACAPEVYLVHSERRGDAPAVKSRWLWRLETLARGAGVTLPGRPELLAWAADLDRPGPYKPAPRPRPRPPVKTRPRQLPVTGVEQWLRDPYSVYARRILRLRPIAPPDEPIGPQLRGSAIHEAFERFANDYSGPLSEDACAAFADLLVKSLENAGMPPPRLVRERALAQNVAPWVVDFENRRRPGAELMVEAEGRISFEAPAGPFTVTAKADRIELRAACADILDFKSGAPPSTKQVLSGLAPQLTLTAAILHFGGFEAAGARPPGELLYVRVSGGRVPAKEQPVEGVSLELGLAALDGLKRRVARFDDAETPYISWAVPQFIDKYAGDYDHLARLWEWHVIGEGEASEGGE